MRTLLCIIALLSTTIAFGQSHFTVLQAKSVTVVPGVEDGAVTTTTTFVLVCNLDEATMVGFKMSKDSNLMLHRSDTLKVQITTQDRNWNTDPTYYGSTKRPITTGSVYVNGMPITCSVPPGVVTDEDGIGRAVAVFHFETEQLSSFFQIMQFTEKDYLAMP